MGRLLREPLLHFFLLGAGLFVVHSAIGARRGAEPQRLVVSAGAIEHLATTFARAWQRPPSDRELDGLIQDYVREEIYAREAVALGLDRDDVIIRRRLRQKLEFVSEDVGTEVEPSDDALRAYLAAHADAFRSPPRVTLSQVYLDPKRHGENLARDATHLLASLRRAGAGLDISQLGDSVLLPLRLDAVPVTEVAKQFGDEFATEVSALTPGQWHGPVTSGYGAHLVFVTERIEGRAPGLEEVRDAVRREWLDARRVEAKDRFYRALLERYDVRIETRPTVPEEQVAKAGQ